MKKIILLAAAVIVAAATVSAQPRAIGLRLGYGASVSYQHSLGENMLSIDADLPAFAAVGAAVTYDWLNPFGTSINWSPRGEWNWYLGVGASGGFDFLPHKPVDDVQGYSRGAGYIGAAGRAGLEYTFWFPLQLAVEWRPTFGVSMWGESWTDSSGSGRIHQGGSGFFTGGLYAGAIALCVRYRF